MPFHDDRDYLDRLKSRAIGLRNVFFHGAYLPAELPRILSELDVLVVPSLWWESFCLTIREAQLAGVPVIASDLGAMREALDGEECGLLFHAGDARELADRIDRAHPRRRAARAALELPRRRQDDRPVHPGAARRSTSARRR